MIGYMADYTIEITEPRTWRKTVSAGDIAEAHRDAIEILETVARGDGRYVDVEFAESMTTTVAEVR